MEADTPGRFTEDGFPAGRNVDLYNQAVIALNEGKLDEAESRLTRLVENEPGGD